MVRLLVCLVLLLASPVFTSICNLENCYDISSSDLKSGVQLDEIVNSFNLSTVKFVALTGQAQDNCSISLRCTSNEYTNSETKLTIEQIGQFSTVRFTHNPQKHDNSYFETLVNTKVERTFNTEIDVGLKFHLNGSVFANFYTESLEMIECPYLAAEHDDIKVYIKQSAKLLKGENNRWETITRDLSATNCGDDLTISLCPCSEPVITELSWDRETETLHCTAASIEGSENLNVTWTENNTSVQNVTEEFNITEPTKTSILNNMKSLEISRNITCTVSLLSNNVNVSQAARTITIPVRSDDSEHPDGEASKDTDGENTNSQAFLTILITIIVVSVVAVALICVGVIKLVQHYKDNKTPEPPTLDAVEPTAGNSEVDEGAIIHLYEEDRGSGTQIDSNYQDLEELLDAVEPRV